MRGDNVLKRAWLLTIALQVLFVVVAAGVPQGNTRSQKQRAPGSAPAAKRTPDPLTTGAANQVRRAVSAVGLILVRSHRDTNTVARPRGSAVVVRKDGLVATNYHVIHDSRSGRIYDEIFLSLSSDGEVSAASKPSRLKTALINRQSDLALLLVERPADGSSTSFPAIQFGDSKSLRLLDDIFIIGYPEKGGLTVTINRGSVEGKDLLGNWIKTDGRMIHGNSGGAVVNRRGEFVGIPTKVVADTQPIDKDGDGLPEGVRVYGAVGFVRPAYLVSGMIRELDRREPSGQHQSEDRSPIVIQSAAEVTVRGIVKSSLDGRPIPGAVLGLLPPGTINVTQEALLTWANANPDGRFVFNKTVPPARYTLRARAIGFEVSSREVTIDEKNSSLVIELRPLSSR
jgi:S1-C subfamily serine protease